LGASQFLGLKCTELPAPGLDYGKDVRRAAEEVPIALAQLMKYADIDDLGSQYGCGNVSGVLVSVDGKGLRLKAEVYDGDDGESG